MCKYHIVLQFFYLHVCTSAGMLFINGFQQQKSKLKYLQQTKYFSFVYTFRRSFPLRTNKKKTQNVNFTQNLKIG